MALIVQKFGGSSVAQASQFKKVRDIIQADPDRRYVVVSAPGKRFSNDSKITDLLYLLDAHRTYHVDGSNVFRLIKERFLEIKEELDLKQPIEKELDQRFYRVGRSMILNLNSIRRITKTEVHLLDGTALALPRGAYEPLNRAVISYT